MSKNISCPSVVLQPFAQSSRGVHWTPALMKPFVYFITFDLIKNVYSFVAANLVRQSVCLKNQTEQMDNHFVTFIKFVLTYNFCHYLAGGQWPPLLICDINKTKIASEPFCGIWCNLFIWLSSQKDSGGTPPTLIFHFQLSIYLRLFPRWRGEQQHQREQFESAC